jgi:hypothetical protein
MSESAPEPKFGTESQTVTAEQATTIGTVVEQLNTAELHHLDIYEGELTGALYADVTEGFERVTVTPVGLELETVEEPDEELNPVTRIQPEPGQTILDAADSLSFAGD